MDEVLAQQMGNCDGGRDPEGERESGGNKHAFSEVQAAIVDSRGWWAIARQRLCGSKAQAASE